MSIKGAKYPGSLNVKTFIDYFGNQTQDLATKRISGIIKSKNSVAKNRIPLKTHYRVN